MCVKTSEILSVLLSTTFCLAVLLPGFVTLRNSIHRNVPPDEATIAVLASFGRGLPIFLIACIVLGVFCFFRSSSRGS